MSVVAQKVAEETINLAGPPPAVIAAAVALGISVHWVLPQQCISLPIAVVMQPPCPPKVIFATPPPALTAFVTRLGTVPPLAASPQQYLLRGTLVHNYVESGKYIMYVCFPE